MAAGVVLGQRHGDPVVRQPTTPTVHAPAPVGAGASAFTPRYGPRSLTLAPRGLP
ncbi:hypothetical protein [Nonomuraea terrae]|uniref:hypothetical protein n=1 Tax=Nonomuraea terrae TaxID=2530383 RepID=UPI0014055A41|nr:hypothetical protein [Nonomuraea terrae]